MQPRSIRKPRRTSGEPALASAWFRRKNSPDLSRGPRESGPPWGFHTLPPTTKTQIASHQSLATFPEKRSQKRRSRRKSIPGLQPIPGSAPSPQNEIRRRRDAFEATVRRLADLHSP